MTNPRSKSTKTRHTMSNSGPSKKEMLDWLDEWIRDKERIRKVWEKHYRHSVYFRTQVMMLRAIRDLIEKYGEEK